MKFLKSHNSIEKRLINIEDRLIHMEERLEHLEERCKIVDEDKIEDMRARLIHIEDKNDRLLKAGILKYKKMASFDDSAFCTAEDIQYDFGIFGLWFTQNYGAALTSYALYKELEQLGYSAALIDLPQISGGGRMHMTWRHQIDYS